MDMAPKKNKIPLNLFCVFLFPKVFVYPHQHQILSQALSFDGGSPPSPLGDLLLQETFQLHFFPWKKGGWRCQVSKFIIPNLERSPQELT